MGVLGKSHGPLGTLGWEGQWDCGGLGGTWESWGLPMAPLGLWDGKDSGTVVVLVGHGNPKDFPWSPSLVTTNGLSADKLPHLGFSPRTVYNARCSAVIPDCIS